MSTIYNRTTIPAKINPGPIVSKMYKGFSTVSTDSNNFVLYDFDLIKQDLLNHFYIRQGERLMQPRFGTVIWDLLFEPMTEQVKDLITQNVNEILNYDPRIQASDIIITPYETGLQIECTLKYLLYNIQERLQMKFDQANNIVR